MPEDASQNLTLDQKLQMSAEAQVNALARLVILQDSIVVLARTLALATADPARAMETYITDLTAHTTARPEMQDHRADGLSFQLGAHLDNLLIALRSSVPGVAQDTSRN